MFDWFPWLAGGSTIALLVLALVAPSVLQVAASWLTALAPLVKAVAEGIVYFLKLLWAGLSDIVDNLATVVTVVVLVLVAVWYFHKPCPACPQVQCPASKSKSVSNGKTSPVVQDDAWSELKRTLGF